ncbi:unnamed protein product [Dovyalis caffra]|uniref:Uncharacterized protein n=1 Tax=Dovyalis caffra TaxID=77055 RepID=A0AAV1RW85_9ROSI|nr:unnamed protein product [Dovyalis caffra]
MSRKPRSVSSTDHGLSELLCLFDQVTSAIELFAPCTSQPFAQRQINPLLEALPIPDLHFYRNGPEDHLGPSTTQLLHLLPI